MKMLTGPLPALLLTASAAIAQNNVLTRPGVPPAEVLNRLNLKLAWWTYVPIDGKRDGIYTAQVLGDHLLVQTRSGGVVMINIADGSTAWRTRVGVSYRVSHHVGHNARLLFAVNGTTLIALDRRTGEVLWQYQMPGAASATPVADEKQLYLSLAPGRIVVLALPAQAPAAAPPAAGEKRPEVTPPPAPAAPYGAGTAAGQPALVGPVGGAGKAAVGPRPLWDYLTIARLEQAPLLSENMIVLATTDGTFFAMFKDAPRVQYRFEAKAALSAPVGPHLTMGYVPSLDYKLYALEILAGKIKWIFTGAGPILKKPEVTNAGIFVAPEGAGLYFLDHNTGGVLWRNPAASRFLASNNKFVYATDPRGRLMILDARRGTQLALYDTRDFIVPISNELTDRLFLASHDGLVVCLHDREYASPLRMKTVEEEKPAAAKPPAGKEPEKPAEKAEPKPEK